jgi:hypothetical protein
MIVGVIGPCIAFSYAKSLQGSGVLPKAKLRFAFELLAFHFFSMKAELSIENEMKS